MDRLESLRSRTASSMASHGPDRSGVLGPGPQVRLLGAAEGSRDQARALLAQEQPHPTGPPTLAERPRGPREAGRRGPLPSSCTASVCRRSPALDRGRPHRREVGHRSSASLFAAIRLTMRPSGPAAAAISGSMRPSRRWSRGRRALAPSRRTGSRTAACSISSRPPPGARRPPRARRGPRRARGCWTPTAGEDDLVLVHPRASRHAPGSSMTARLRRLSCTRRCRAPVQEVEHELAHLRPEQHRRVVVEVDGHGSTRCWIARGPGAAGAAHCSDRAPLADQAAVEGLVLLDDLRSAKDGAVARRGASALLQGGHREAGPSRRVGRAVLRIHQDTGRTVDDDLGDAPDPRASTAVPRHRLEGREAEGLLGARRQKRSAGARARRGRCAGRGNGPGRRRRARGRRAGPPERGPRRRARAGVLPLRAERLSASAKASTSQGTRLTLRKLLMWMAEASRRLLGGRNSSRSTKLGITWMPQGACPRSSPVRAAGSSETAVTASEALTRTGSGARSSGRSPRA